MRLIVVDPELIVRGFAHPRSNPARLLALCAYGRVCLNADGQPLVELEGSLDLCRQEGQPLADENRLRALKQRAQRDVESAQQRKAVIEDALQQHVPEDVRFGLATSPPLRDELVRIAQKVQGDGRVDIVPELILRQTNGHTAFALTELEPAPFYLGEHRVSAREYLIHTAVVAKAAELITDDPKLALPGDSAFRDPKTRRTVRPFSLQEFVAEMPYICAFGDIDAAGVLRAAVRPLSREPA